MDDLAYFSNHITFSINENEAILEFYYQDPPNAPGDEPVRHLIKKIVLSHKGLQMAQQGLTTLRNKLEGMPPTRF